MQRKIIAGRITTPQRTEQTRLYHHLGEFALWMQRRKDAAEVQKDRQKSVPADLLPMLF